MYSWPYRGLEALTGWIIRCHNFLLLRGFVTVCLSCGVEISRRLQIVQNSELGGFLPFLRYHTYWPRGANVIVGNIRN